MTPRSLDEFGSEQGETPPPRFRTGFADAAAATTGYGLALCAWVALRCDSLVFLVNRKAHDARTRLAVVREPHLRSEPSSFDRLESEGSCVAAALAIVAVGYGGLLLMSWRDPAASVSAVEVPARTLSVEPIAGAALHAIPPAAVVPTDNVVDVHPRSGGVSPTALQTIWRRTDTRSLQQAFTSLRRETLAFHRCSMQLTETDHAVARCESAATGLSTNRVRWTLDFRRTGNRWAIQRVSSR